MGGFGKRTAPPTEAARKPGDKRQADRDTVYRNVRVFLHDGSVVQCIARDVSPNGCKIAGNGVGSLPDHVEISMDMGAKMISADIVWRNESEAGLAFVSDDEEPAQEGD